MLNDQRDKLCNHPEVPNRTKQIQTQIMIERGRPLSGATQGSRKVEEKRPVPRRSIHVLFTKKLSKPIEQGNPLSAVTQITSQEFPKIRSSYESTNFNVGDDTNHDRTGTPDVCRDASHPQGREQSMLNEVNIDFRIFGLPHSVLKQAQNPRVRELVKKIENHPHRHSLQRDLQENEAYNPFSTTSKKMIQDVGNVELFELFETDPKTQCKACLSYWSEGIVYCTCGHLLKETVANRSFIEYTLDLLSIPEYVIKKGRPHGHRKERMSSGPQFVKEMHQKRIHRVP